MTALPALKHDTRYAQLCKLPEQMTGEIIAGQLHSQPRPGGRHGLACGTLSMDIGGPFQLGRNGPGGWWIALQPEVHFVRDTKVTVPDRALCIVATCRRPHPAHNGRSSVKAARQARTALLKVERQLPRGGRLPGTAAFKSLDRLLLILDSSVGPRLKRVEASIGKGLRPIFATAPQLPLGGSGALEKFNVHSGLAAILGFNRGI